MNFLSDRNNFIGEEAHEVIVTESLRNTWLNRALSQPGYSAEKRPGIGLILFYQL